MMHAYKKDSIENKIYNFSTKNKFDSLIINQINHQMGNSHSEEYAKKCKAISVISLNYSGILLSPFEFFSR